MLRTADTPIPSYREGLLQNQGHADRLGSKGVEYGADDAGPRVAQLPDDAGGIGEAGMVLSGEHHHAARAEGQALRVRVELRRRRIEEDDVEINTQLVQQGGEKRAQQ